MLKVYDLGLVDMSAEVPQKYKGELSCAHACQVKCKYRQQM